MKHAAIHALRCSVNCLNRTSLTICPPLPIAPPLPKRRIVMILDDCRAWQKSPATAELSPLHTLWRYSLNGGTQIGMPVSCPRPRPPEHDPVPIQAVSILLKPEIESSSKNPHPKVTLPTSQTLTPPLPNTHRLRSRKHPSLNGGAGQPLPPKAEYSSIFESQQSSSILLIPVSSCFQRNPFTS